MLGGSVRCSIVLTVSTTLKTAVVAARDTGSLFGALQTCVVRAIKWISCRSGVKIQLIGKAHTNCIAKTGVFYSYTPFC